MVLRRVAAAECPKKVAGLVDLVNLPTALREFAGGRSQMSHLSFFLHVWSHIKDKNLQQQVRNICSHLTTGPMNRNIVDSVDKLKTVMRQVKSGWLCNPVLARVHSPTVPESYEY
ncbi:uncharacterized protein LOC133897148 isoform X1 [Phragmites australis]|uniref:uncharacterized protein LOC133897148 isoform X1 n=1 Tax=Phragmites australis TaxID=29695 RepID=UPI002D7825DA|nr:uncharacterized protein LOC133897148 isoform X1 [Phragmites australis]